jgi:uncharacterized protein (TIGR03435 family)
MPQTALTDALEEALRAKPEIRAAALVRIARVWNTTDHDEALRLFERGMAEVRLCAPDSRDYLLQNAAPIGVTITPEAADALATEASNAPSGRYVPMKLVLAMLTHGRDRQATEYLSRLETREDYPFEAAEQASGTTNDAAIRIAVVRGALNAMRHRMADPQTSVYFQPSRFIALFVRHWRLLSEDEARDFVRAFVRWLVDRPDHRTRESIQGLSFSSAREMQLFQLLAPMRHLDAALADSLMAEHQELAAAAARYPLGEESIHIELEQRTRAARPGLPVSDPADPIVAIGPKGPITRSQAMRSQFDDEAFARAEKALDADLAAPNPAPKDSWISTQTFRHIFFEAARAEGAEAFRWIDRIRDADVRLFARIEVAAAIAGLPYLDGTSVGPPPPGFKPRASTPAPPPGSRDAQMLADLMARARAGDGQSLRPFKKPQGVVSPEARVVPSAGEGGVTGGSGPDFWVVRHAHLRPVLARLYDVAPTRIDIAPSLESARFDFSLVLPQPTDRPTMLRLMREGAERAFDVRRERRATDVDVLTAPNGVRVKPERVDDWPGGVSSGFVQSVASDADHDEMDSEMSLADVLSLHAVPNVPDQHRVDTREEHAFLRRLRVRSRITGLSDAVTVAELCEILEGGLDRPLVDETGSRDVFHVSAATERHDRDATRDLLRLVCEQLGLTTTPAIRDFEWLTVRPR